MQQASYETVSPLVDRNTVIVGIGNLMRGDDAFGPNVARNLCGRTRARIIDAGMVPENFLGKIAACDPEIVILVDAVDFNGQPGDVVLIEPGELATTSFGTHTPTLALLESFLSAERDVQVYVLAAQPSATEFDTPMSDTMAKAVDRSVHLIEQADGIPSQDGK